MKFGVVVFPGTWSDRDCGWVVDQVLGAQLQYLWHKDADLKGCDCIILPGGFAYGDYLRTGAIARFAPVMEKVGEFADRGGLVWGICNGFQILCEAGLLPGALIRNASLEFRCEWTNLVVERNDLAYTSQCSEREVIRVPISHGEGSYFADPATCRAWSRTARSCSGTATRKEMSLRVPIRMVRCTTSPASSTSAATCWG
jgi:phosphoribosylformylglycinamidine synthase I